MSPTAKPAKGSSGQKKEKVFHPQSRKAGQLVRTHIRKTKLGDLKKKRSHKQSDRGAHQLL
jgi:translation machinery-associated protein 16